jgi:hypothetical protein
MLASGCGSKGEVSGKVLYQGKPLAGGVVTFLPASGQGAFVANIGEDGSYHLSKVPAGKMKITVKSTSSNPSLSPMQQKMIKENKKKKKEYTKEELEKLPPEMRKALEDSSSSPGKLVPIPPQYGDPEKSGLECTVTGGKQDHNIELK